MIRFIFIFVDELTFAEGGRAPTVVIEFDGWLILSILNGVETLGGGFSIDLRPLSQYQNCSDFSTLVVGIIIAIRHGSDLQSMVASKR